MKTLEEITEKLAGIYEGDTIHNYCRSAITYDHRRTTTIVNLLKLGDILYSDATLEELTTYFIDLPYLSNKVKNRHYPDEYYPRRGQGCEYGSEYFQSAIRKIIEGIYTILERKKEVPGFLERVYESTILDVALGELAFSPNLEILRLVDTSLELPVVEKTIKKVGENIIRNWLNEFDASELRVLAHLKDAYPNIPLPDNIYDHLYFSIISTPAESRRGFRKYIGYQGGQNISQPYDLTQELKILGEIDKLKECKVEKFEQALKRRFKEEINWVKDLELDHFLHVIHYINFFADKDGGIYWKKLVDDDILKFIYGGIITRRPFLSTVQDQIGHASFETEHEFRRTSSTTRIYGERHVKMEYKCAEWYLGYLAKVKERTDRKPADLVDKGTIDSFYDLIDRIRDIGPRERSQWLERFQEVIEH